MNPFYKSVRRPFILTIAVIFPLAYALSDIAHFAVTNLKFYDQYNRERTLEVVNDLKLADTLIRHGERDAILQRLKETQDARKIDYFSIETPNAGARIAPGQIVISDSEAYGAVAFEAGKVLLVGVHKDKQGYLMRAFEDYKTSLILDVLIVSGMMVLLVAYFFRDIGKVIRALRSKKRDSLAALGTARTAEAQIIARGINAYENRIQGLEVERTRLRGQIGPSIRTEIDSGLTPPYQFRCVMVRTDINHYSSIHSNFPLEAFMSVVNEFFTRSSELIERYGGFIASFVGDEIIYYFKEDEHENAAAIAVSLVRDIHAIAEELHASTLQAEGHPFRVKSAIACGTLRYGPQVKGFALSGSAFVETVRILSQVEERDLNSVYLPGRLALRIAPICRAELKKEMELRGIPGVTRLFTVREFGTCEQALAELSPATAGKLKYFRSDADLAKIIRKLRMIVATPATEAPNALKTCAAALESLRTMGLPTGSIAVHDEYARLLLDFFERWERNESDKESRHAAASAVMLSTKIISRQAYAASLREILLKCLASKDRRILSNAIDAFIYFEPECKNELLMQLIRYPDNRVMANALIKQGLTDLNDEVIAGLRTMMRSGDSLYIASAAFAVGELSRHYRATNVTFFDTHLAFQNLLQELTRFSAHADPMVRKQVKICMEKACGSPPLTPDHHTVKKIA